MQQERPITGCISPRWRTLVPKSVTTKSSFEKFENSYKQKEIHCKCNTDWSYNTFCTYNTCCKHNLSPLCSPVKCRGHVYHQGTNTGPNMLTSFHLKERKK